MGTISGRWWFIVLVALGVGLEPAWAQRGVQLVADRPTDYLVQVPPAAAPAASPQPPQTPPGGADQGFGQAPTTGAEALAGASNPGMIGDLIGPSICRVVTLPGGATVMARVPLASLGGFKVAENESPRPTDRVFFTYNYYSNVDRSLNGPEVPRFDVHQELMGFEKTFLGGDASVGLRVPVFEQDGVGSLGLSDFGDLSVVLKYAFVNDRRTGDVLAAGLVITAPTGRDFVDCFGETVHPVWLQPYGGYVWTAGRLYLLGFTSLAVPTDDRAPTLLFNDVGVGYRIPCPGDSFVTAVAPTFEVHVNTPLNHRGSAEEPFGVPDWIDLTAGCHLELCRRSTLTFGVATPVTGPQPFDVEAIVQFNLRF